MSLSVDLSESDVGHIDVADILALREHGLTIEDAVDIALEVDNPQEVLTIAHDDESLEVDE